MRAKAEENPCSIEIKAGKNNSRYAVAFLEHSASYVDIKPTFEHLGANVQRYHLKSFDYWIGGFHINDRFHGWNKSQHKGKYARCFVFKNVSEGERLYGFLCKPKGEDQNYEMCVLVLYAQKKRWNTDTAELDRAELMRNNPDVQAALKDPNLFTKGVGKKK